MTRVPEISPHRYYLLKICIRLTRSLAECVTLTFAGINECVKKQSTHHACESCKVHDVSMFLIYIFGCDATG